MASEASSSAADTWPQAASGTDGRAAAQPAPDSPAQPAQPGSLFTPLASHRFEGVALVGTGGMGAVYGARDRHLQREVAIKVLSPALAEQPKYVRRFMAEAQIQAQLDHPNIIPVHEMDMGHPQARFFTMPLLRGRSLADRISAAHLSPHPAPLMREMLEAFLKVCDAVAFAHSRGVLHLDIKPENILVEDLGAVYLMDWGLARLVERGPANDVVRLSRDATDSMASGVAGSPSYMAPEQAEGSSAPVSERTDIFGLGAVLYAMLSGRAPYLADTIEEVLHLARVGQRPPLSEIPLGLPLLAGLVGIVQRAMATEPWARHASAIELRREVEGHTRGGTSVWVGAMRARRPT